MRINSTQGVYLAALLHDIGKFWQRASDSRKVLKQSTLQMEGSLCPTGQAGFSTHIHALFTSEFFENHSGVLPQQFEHEGKQVEVGNLSARHHKKNLDDLERIIQFADNLSSGHDRRDETEDIASDVSYKYKKIPLLNPFDTVFSIKDSSQRSYFPIVPLCASKSIFARTDIGLDDSKQDDYARLWGAFEAEMSQVPSGSFSAQATTLLGLLKKYTWCIPSATNSMPDISLYDHLKTTAAIAACLHATEQIPAFGKLPETFEGLKYEEKERFVLLAGDFSGIQKFIYQLSSKGAAKTLKGRSFYLNLVQDVILQKLKSIFSIEDAHILMESGGRFQVLIPNDAGRIAEFRSFVANVNNELRNDFGQAIYLAIGHHTFTANNFLLENGYSEVVKAAYRQVERDKSRRYADIIDDDFFKPMPVSGTKAGQVCHVTGLDLQDYDTETLDDDEGLIVSKKVHEQIRLGRWLRNARYILKIRKARADYGKKEIMPLPSSQKNDAGDGIVFRFYTVQEEEKISKALREEQVVQIVSLNDTSFMEFSSKEADFSSVFRFYGASWTPAEKNGKPVEFADIAKDDANNLMAVLRMDVDNLGELFRSGFKYKAEDLPEKHLGSISRYSNMSEKLELFFSGYLNHLFSEEIKEEDFFDKSLLGGSFSDDDPRQHVLPVYAGGDDVFVICRWDIAPLLAQSICTRFKEFTNHHPRITLSGGVAMVHGKFPVHKAAKESEDYERKAKSLQKNSLPDGKEAFCLFGQAMSWDDFSLAQSYVKQIIEWQNQMDTRTVLGFLRDLYAEYTGTVHFGRWRWRSAYRLKRIGSRYNNEEDMAELASWLFNGTFKGKKFNRVEKTKTKRENEEYPPELVDLTGLAVRWVQSVTRTKS